MILRVRVGGGGRPRSSRGRLIPVLDVELEGRPRAWRLGEVGEAGIEAAKLFGL